MPSPSAIPNRAHVCTNKRPAHIPSVSDAGIAYAVSQCGEFITVSQIIMALGLDPSTLPASVESNIRAWLDDAGWERVKKNTGGARAWGYVKRASKDDQPGWEKDELMAAIVHRPQLGQLLMPILIRRPYSVSATVELVNLNALQRSLALSLLSSDNSLNIASTSAALDELSTALASALALCNRSKAAMNSSTAPGGTSMDCSSLSRTSNASGVSLDWVSSMDFSHLMSKDAHGKAALTAHQAGGAL